MLLERNAGLLTRTIKVMQGTRTHLAINRGSEGVMATAQMARAGLLFKKVQSGGCSSAREGGREGRKEAVEG